MPNVGIAVINASTVLQNAEVDGVVPALQAQVSGHLAPVWGVDAELIFVPRGESPPEGAWWLSILDNTDQAGLEGYHDLTDEGLPMSKVFAGSDMMLGLVWTVTASHELLEMLIDPDINRCVLIENDAGSGRLYAYEICDPCEADQFGYPVNDVLVSDFVFPSWFEPFRAPNSCQFDVMQQIARPFDLAPGGYIHIYDINRGNGWHQLNAAAMPRPYISRSPVGSRRERRRSGRRQWMRSAVPNRL